MLIGGSGADQVTGGGADDILIAGKTSYYDEATGTADLAALDALMAEWSRTAETFSQRTTNLQNGTGQNAPNKLDGTTVFDDGAVDQLFKGSAGQDWFIVSATDTLSGNTSSDKVTTV
jgi:hypothetical protein